MQHIPPIYSAQGIIQLFEAFQGAETGSHLVRIPLSFEIACKAPFTDIVA